MRPRWLRLSPELAPGGHAITTIYYVVERARNRAVAATAVSDLLQLLTVVPLGNADFQRVLGLGLRGRLAFNATKWPVRAEGDLVGRVTSAVWSPRLERNIGYAMVTASHAVLGTGLEVEIPGEDARPAMVVPKPFLDPEKAIPKRELVGQI